MVVTSWVGVFVYVCLVREGEGDICEDDSVIFISHQHPLTPTLHPQPQELVTKMI
jgi:hypothetical protein